MTLWPLIFLATDSGDNFIVIKPCYVSEIDIIIKKGFVTDLSSIPKLLRWAISPSGKTKNASVVHDYLIRNKIFDEKKADQVFKELMINSGVRPIQASIMYSGLRLASHLKLRN